MSCRPRVGLQEAHDLSDVQRFYIIMAPTSREGAPLRLAAVGKKQLPQTGDRFWACIQGLGQKVQGHACIWSWAWLDKCDKSLA